MVSLRFQELPHRVVPGDLVLLREDEMGEAGAEEEEAFLDGEGSEDQGLEDGDDAAMQIDPEEEEREEEGKSKPSAGGRQQRQEVHVVTQEDIDQGRYSVFVYFVVCFCLPFIFFLCRIS